MFSCAVSVINAKIDEIVAELAKTGVRTSITQMINDSVAESMSEGSYSGLVDIVSDNGGKVRSISVDSMKVNLFRADVSRRVSEKLESLEKFYVDIELGNVLDDAFFWNWSSCSFAVDILPTGGVETDVESEFISAGINQTNYRMNLKVNASVTMDVVSAFTVDVSTGVNIVDVVIVGDVPTVCWS